ncbi:MAG: T9SS type A sorting domain-containing protein, partial [Fimbriimonadaceae bacterium]|nr:T9SS type A sorting domain-containing protein [Chitinophagales bacterium]
GGHTLPTPCDIPADPFGYHGEFEDYDVVIEEATSINNEYSSFIKPQIYPNPAAEEFTISYTSQNNEDLFIKIMSLSGEMLFQYGEKNMIAGVQKNIEINCSDLNIAPGNYVVILSKENEMSITPVIIIY